MGPLNYIGKKAESTTGILEDTRVDVCLAARGNDWNLESTVPWCKIRARCAMLPGQSMPALEPRYITLLLGGSDSVHTSTEPGQSQLN